MVNPKTSWTLPRFVHRIVPVSAGEGAGGTDGHAVKTAIFSDCTARVQQRNRIMCDGDGGHGAAVLKGRAGEMVAPVDVDQYSTSEESTLPPPYSAHHDARY